MVAPFDYVALLWAFFFGYVLFGEIPSRYVHAGATIVAGFGLFVWRERQLLDRFHETDHIRDVIPGRHRKVASPESIAPASGYGFRARARARPGMTLHMIRTSKSLY